MNIIWVNLLVYSISYWFSRYFLVFLCWFGL